MGYLIERNLSPKLCETRRTHAIPSPWITFRFPGASPAPGSNRLPRLAVLYYNLFP
jgi:hypothetical protein